MALHPHLKSFQTHLGDPAIHRAGGRAKLNREFPELTEQFQILWVPRHNRAARGGTMARDEFGQRMNHDIGAKTQRLLMVGCGKGVVHDQPGPMRMRQICLLYTSRCV